MRRVSAALLLTVALAAGAVLSGSLTGCDRAEPPETGTATGTAAEGAVGGDLTPEQRRELERIATLGYIAGSEPVPSESGVVRHEGGTYDGLTLYSGSEESAAFLVDMDGNVVHSWRYPGFKSWGRVRLFENGDLLVITEDYPHLMKLDRDSRLLWEWNKAAHHDMEVQPDGSIAVLVSEEATRPYICDGKPFLTDSIIILGPGGKPLWRTPVLEAFERSERFADWLDGRLEPGHTDPLHANSIEVFIENGRRHALISIRNIDTIAVIDIESTEIVRTVTGPWHRQHEARFVESGRILLFDNLSNEVQSRVIEYDPDSEEIVWSYTEPGFLSKTEGAQQRLPNGNTLIVESDNGRLVEVTRDGHIVWEYINPATTVVDGEEVILGIARAERLEPDFPTAWAHGEDR